MRSGFALASPKQISFHTPPKRTRRDGFGRENPMVDHNSASLLRGPSDAALLESVRFTIAEIAAVFVVPELCVLHVSGFRQDPEPAVG